MPNLAKSLRSLQNKTNQILPGTLGLSTSLVNVPNRAGYSYVQLLGNTNELIQAYNAVVTPQYGLPVLVQWNGTRYVIIGRDVSRYTQWSYSAYLPLHGDTHQWNGGDTTWVHSEQLYPLSVSPSGTSLFIAPYSYNWKGVWVYGGMTGTSIITLPIDPTKQKIMLLYLDGPTGNPVWLAGTEAPLYTQAYQLLPYLPTFNLSLGIPLSMIAIPSGTTSWSWSNIYDLRQFIGGMSVPSGTWGGIPEAPQDGFTYGRKNAAWSPVSGSSGIGEAPIDGNVYGRKNAGWSVVSGSSGAAYSLPTGSNSILGGFRVGTGLSVYPDGTLNVTGSSSTGTSGVPEAPNDGNPYIRQSDGWKALMATAGSVSGGTESDDGTYHYHIFTSGGTLTVISSTVVDVLVVAGGGAGGTYNGGQGGGGGGAGGLCYQAHRTLTVGSKTVVVGNGGNAPAGNGQDSTFDGIDAVGGGGGGGVSGGANGKNGGSGGAGSGGGTGGSATQGNSSGATGYGNAGANAGGNGAEGGGGGGAGSAGAQAIGNAGGIGGTGNSYNISGAATTYAVGGTGGGNGEGAPGSAGGANTGNGGGSDAAGGSGIVIIRHPSSITVATTDVMFKSVYDTDNNGIIDSSALPITTSLGTPGVDTLIPTEKAVRSAIGAISGSSSGGSFSVTGTSVTNDFISFADSSGKTGIDSGYGPASFAPSGTYARIELTATLTYYVRTDGNDSNNGLANTSGGAFLTIQHAINVASALDNGGYNITIQVADGTYVSATEIDMKSFVGSGLIIIQGNTTTPANCVLSFSGAGSTGFSASGVVGVYQIQGFRLKATNTGTFAISVINFSYINIQNLDFNTGWSTHISSQLQAAVNIIGNYTISGSANAHMDNEASIISCYATITVTISGTPAWGYYFTHCGAAGWTYIEHGTVTYSGASTGKRYVADTNGILGTDGGGSTYFPGNAAGTTATGGLYS